MKKSAELMLQTSLVFTIVILVLINLVPAWAVYQSLMTIKTEKISGSSLAERYLILGDWPADSGLSSVIEDNHKYLVTSTKSSKSKLSTED